jgi:hypothetical protein
MISISVTIPVSAVNAAEAALPVILAEDGIPLATEDGALIVQG